MSGRVEGDLRIVTGKSCGIAAPPWAPLDLQVGLPEVDAALRNNFETIEGTPIETVTRVSRQLGSGEKLHATIDELGVGRRLDQLEVVPGGEMADQRLGVDAGEFFFADRERDDRNVGRLDALVAEFLVERHVGVAVDGRDHGGLLAGRAELLDVGDTIGLPVGVTERACS